MGRLPARVPGAFPSALLLLGLRAPVQRYGTEVEHAVGDAAESCRLHHAAEGQGIWEGMRRLGKIGIRLTLTGQELAQTRHDLVHVAPGKLIRGRSELEDHDSPPGTNDSRHFTQSERAVSEVAHPEST